MNELLKVNYDNERITVSARELHEYLGIKERFSKWFERMITYGFGEGVDFTNVKKSTEVQNNGGIQIRELQDYQITIDMAKEIAMLQRNEKGKQIRKYLIEIEKKWNSPEFIMNRALEYSRKQVEQLMLENSQMKPKADYFDELVNRNLLTNLRDTAKELHIKQNDFVNYILNSNYIYRDQRGNLRPYSKYIDNGLFELKEFSSKKSGHCGVQTLVTPKGRETFRLLLNRDKG